MNFEKFGLKPIVVVFVSVLIFSSCVSKESSVCVQGDCINGVGITEDSSGKYKNIYEGEFRNGKLWDGVVKGDMVGVTRVMLVYKNGVIVKDLRRPK